MVPGPDNATIADRLEAFAALLDLAGASNYSTRAYRRAAELIRATTAPVADLVRAGRARELRGIGPSIEARLVELVETGEIAELRELEREVAAGARCGRQAARPPAKRSVEIGRALGVRDGRRAARGDPRRPAARRAGRRPEDGGEARRRARPRAAGAGARAAAEPGLGARGGDRCAAGSRRRRRPAPLPRAQRAVRRRACCGPPGAVLDAFEALPQIVVVTERDERRALGVTVEGVPVELVVPRPESSAPHCPRHGLGRLRRSARAAAGAPDEESRLPGARRPVLPARAPRGAVPRARRHRSSSSAEIRGDLHVHTTWSDGKASVLEMGEAARELGYEYLAICDHTPNVRVVPGLDADDIRRQGEEIAAANEHSRPSGSSAAPSATSCRRVARPPRRRPRRARLGAGVSVHAGQRQPRERADAAHDGGDAAPGRPLPQPPAGAHHQPPAAEPRSTSSALRGRARDRRARSRSTGSRTGSTSRDEHVRDAIEAGVPIVCSTDAHSVAASGTWSSPSPPRAAAGRPPPTSSTPGR